MPNVVLGTVLDVALKQQNKPRIPAYLAFVLMPLSVSEPDRKRSRCMHSADHLWAYSPFCVQAKNLGLPSIQLIASKEEAILALVPPLSINGTSAYSDTQTKTYRSLLDHQVLFLPPLISFSAVTILVQSTVISCLDYCRSLLVDTVS